MGLTTVRKIAYLFWDNPDDRDEISADAISSGLRSEGDRAGRIQGTAHR
jgi:hypothetical protein